MVRQGQSVTPSHVALAIRRRREDLELTQETAARLAGLSVATWANIERGSTRPTAATIRGVAAALRWPAPFMDDIEAGREPGALGSGDLASDLADIAAWNPQAHGLVRSLIETLAAEARSSSRHDS